MFSEAVIDKVQIRNSHVDIGSAFSMMISTLYDRFPSRPSINSCKSSAPDIVGVVGASPDLRHYIDGPLQIAKIEVAYPLLVISNRLFSLLI